MQLLRHIRFLTAIVLSIVLASSGFAPVAANQVSEEHYIYTCPGYSYDPNTGHYNIPADCHANPAASPATHQWITEQVPNILRGDGHTDLADFLASPVRDGYGAGKSHLELLREGTVAADTRLHDCSAGATAAGWPIGDHMLNPYRHFGVWSYNTHEQPGWQGYLYRDTNGRRTGICRAAPRIRSHAALMNDEFVSRAGQAWRRGAEGEAMYNLGIALHLIQDVSVPSHAHPESNFEARDKYPAWANARKANYPATSGGVYQLPASVNGVTVPRTGSGWVYWMAATTYPYFPQLPENQITPQTARCNVTDDPEGCLSDSVALLHLSQRASAGFVKSFLDIMPRYNVEWVRQSAYPTLHPGQSATLTVDYRNTGTVSWAAAGPHPLRLGISKPRDHASGFASANWLSPNRPASFVGRVDQAGSVTATDTVRPGETARFSFTTTVPNVPPGAYREYVEPVVEGVTWINYPWVYWTINVV